MKQQATTGLFSWVDLADRLDHQLPGGQQPRIMAIATSPVKNPQILLAD